MSVSLLVKEGHVEAKMFKLTLVSYEPFKLYTGDMVVVRPTNAEDLKQPYTPVIVLEQKTISSLFYVDK